MPRAHHLRLFLLQVIDIFGSSASRRLASAGVFRSGLRQAADQVSRPRILIGQREPDDLFKSLLFGARNRSRIEQALRQRTGLTASGCRAGKNSRLARDLSAT